MTATSYKPSRLRLFHACEDVKFRAGDLLLLLSAGEYSCANGAIMVFRESGEPECVLTRNLGELMETLAEDEFFVRLQTKEDSCAPQALLDHGVFEETERVVAQGFVQHYAAVWRFAVCRNPSHDGHQEPAILCTQCKAGWRERVRV